MSAVIKEKPAPEGYEPKGYTLMKSKQQLRLEFNVCLNELTAKHDKAQMYIYEVNAVLARLKELGEKLGRSEISVLAEVAEKCGIIDEPKRCQVNCKKACEDCSFGC